MAQKKKLIITAVLIAIAICAAVVVDALGYIIPAPDSYIGDVVAENGKTYRQFKTYNILGKTKLGIDGYSFTYDAGNDWRYGFELIPLGMLDTYQYSYGGIKTEGILSGNSSNPTSLTAIHELLNDGVFMRDDCRTERIGKNSIGEALYLNRVNDEQIDIGKDVVCDVLYSLAAQLFTTPAYKYDEDRIYWGSLYFYNNKADGLYSLYDVTEYAGNYYIECPPYIFGRFILSDSSVFYRAYRLPQSAVDVMFGEGA